MNVTLSVDDQVVERARKKAEALGKSLNQVIREYLQKLAATMRSVGAKSSSGSPAKAIRADGNSTATRSMSARSFLDTNVIVYADDKRSESKQRRAVEFLSKLRVEKAGVVSLQVLQEYFVTVTKKLGVDAATARRKVELLAEFDVLVPTVDDVLAAIDLHRLHALSFWDALILHSAKQAGCNQLLTDDMQHTQVITGLQIVNPFA